MATEINNSYINAPLADATYALDEATPNGDAGDTLLGRLDKRMTPTLTKYVNDNFMVDTYTFDGSFGQDSVKDADGQGRIQINGQTLGKFSAAGERNTYSAKLGDGSTVTLKLEDDSASSTGLRGVVTLGDGLATSGDGISIPNFNLAQAQGSQGYMGIRLDGKQKVALIQGTPITPRNTSKSIAYYAFTESDRCHFYYESIAANDGCLRRAA